MDINISQLTKKYGTKTVLNISGLTLKNGAIISLIGNNGAGKTTFLRLLLDFLTPTTGEISFIYANGKKLNPTLDEDWKRYTGAFLDKNYLIDYLTPQEYFNLITQLYEIPEYKKEEIFALFHQFIGDEILKTQKLIRYFSDGNKQKIGIISAFLVASELIILDEPFNFLDPSSQYALKKILQEYNNKTQCLIIMSSHNIEHCIDISQRILLLEEGKIIKDVINNEHSTEEILKSYFTK
jgi:ABC transporter, ATP-binding protein